MKCKTTDPLYKGGGKFTVIVKYNTYEKQKAQEITLVGVVAPLITTLL